MHTPRGGSVNKAAFDFVSSMGGVTHRKGTTHLGTVCLRRAAIRRLRNASTRAEVQVQDTTTQEKPQELGKGSHGRDKSGGVLCLSCNRYLLDVMSFHSPPLATKIEAAAPTEAPKVWQSAQASPCREPASVASPEVSP